MHPHCATHFGMNVPKCGDGALSESVAAAIGTNTPIALGQQDAPSWRNTRNRHVVAARCRRGLLLNEVTRGAADSLPDCFTLAMDLSGFEFALPAPEPELTSDQRMALASMTEAIKADGGARIWVQSGGASAGPVGERRAGLREGCHQ